MRVWLPDTQAPGLAMTRSIGDRLVREIGVIPDPSIYHIGLSPEDKFIIVGSDGLFEYLEMNEVSEIVSKHLESGDMKQACEDMIHASKTKWTEE